MKKRILLYDGMYLKDVVCCIPSAYLHRAVVVVEETERLEEPYNYIIQWEE